MSPLRVYSICWVAAIGAVGSPVDCSEPVVIRLSIEPTVTPRPTCSGLEPATLPLGPAPARTSCESSSTNVVRWALNPTVSTLARLLAVTSSIVWCASKPLIAAYMPRIIGASLPFAASSQRSSRACVVLPRSSCDHGAVDVCEHVLAHVLGSHRRDDGVVRDRHHVCGAVNEDHGVPGALARRARHAAGQAVEHRLGQLDPALAQA